MRTTVGYVLHFFRSELLRDVNGANGTFNHCPLRLGGVRRLQYRLDAPSGSFEMFEHGSIRSGAPTHHHLLHYITAVN